MRNGAGSIVARNTAVVSLPTMLVASTCKFLAVNQHRAVNRYCSGTMTLEAHDAAAFFLTADVRVQGGTFTITGSSTAVFNSSSIIVEKDGTGQCLLQGGLLS